jgi:hypothetical protein
LSLGRFHSIRSGELTSSGIEPYLTATFRNQMEITASYLLGRDRPRIVNDQGSLEWNREMYPQKGPYFYMNYSGHRLFQAGADAIFLSCAVYSADFRQAKAGKSANASAWMKVKISPSWQWEWRIEHTGQASSDRSIDFQGNIFSSSLRWQASRMISTFAKFQYDSLQKRFGYDFILLFEPAPVSRMSISLKNFCEERFRIFAPQARTLAIKLSYLIRL